MADLKPIGGYFELELPKYPKNPPPSGRAVFGSIPGNTPWNSF
jgi:hypothetical protein